MFVSLDGLVRPYGRKWAHLKLQHARNKHPEQSDKLIAFAAVDAQLNCLRSAAQSCHDIAVLFYLCEGAPISVNVLSATDKSESVQEDNARASNLPLSNVFLPDYTQRVTK